MQSPTDAPSLDRKDIASIVIAYISEFFFITESTILESSRFEEDLCADSLLLTDCIDALEEEFTERALGFSIDAQEREELETVKDLIDMIADLVIDNRKDIS